MAGLWVLVLLILIAALPVLPAYLWFRSFMVHLSALWFVLSLLTGAVSLLIAGVLQTAFFYFFYIQEAAAGTQFFTIFIKIALTEEAGRLLALMIFFRLGKRFSPDPEDSRKALSFGAAAGLLAGLGFGIIETASYGAANINIALLRAFTATPLHGACGARVGMGLILFKQNPIQGICRFLSAVAMHGMYNFMVINHGIPRIFPILIAFSALIASIQIIRNQ